MDKRTNSEKQLNFDSDEYNEEQRLDKIKFREIMIAEIEDKVNDMESQGFNDKHENSIERIKSLEGQKRVGHLIPQVFRKKDALINENQSHR